MARRFRITVYDSDRDIAKTGADYRWQVIDNETGGTWGPFHCSQDARVKADELEQERPAKATGA